MMYTYFVVFLLLFITSFTEVMTKKHRKKKNYIYMSMFLVLLFMCTFRYGQGTDYFNYQRIYESYSGNSILQNMIVYRDLFFSAFFYFGNVNAIPFEYLVSLISVLSLLMFNRFNIKYNNYPTSGLFVFYSLFHLTYHYSAIREGFAISFFLAFMYPLLLSEKIHYRYYLLGILVTLMHGSAVITLLFPIVQKLNIKKRFIPFVIVAITLSSIVFTLPFGTFFESRMEGYLENSEGISVFAIMTRIIALLPIFLVKSKDYIDKKNTNLYASFFFIYLVFISVPTLAARVTIYAQILSIIVFTLPMKTMRRGQRCAYYSLAAVFCCIMYFKCINSYIVNGDYNNSVSVINYPYVSVFDESAINKYRLVE